MNALRLANSPGDRTRFDKKCKELLSTAEKLKKSTAVQSGTSSRDDALSRQEPISPRELSKREQIILLEDSKLNGSVFPPWKDEPNPAEFELLRDHGPYVYVATEMISDSGDLALT